MEEDKIMLIKMPYYLKPDARKKMLDEILADKELGVVFVPYGAEVSYIPKDVKIEIIDAGNRCLREIDILKGEDNEQKGRVSS